MTQEVPTSAIEDALYTMALEGGVPVIWSKQDGPRPEAPYVSLDFTTLKPVGQDWVDHHVVHLVFTAFVIVANPSTDALAATAHGLGTGDGPIRLTTTGTLPAGLALATDYFAIKVDADHVKLASTFLDAISGTAIDITDAGTGTHHSNSTADTLRAGAELEHRARGNVECQLSLQCFASTALGTGGAMAVLRRIAARAKLPSVASKLRTAGTGVPTFGPATSSGKVLNAAHFEPRAMMAAQFYVASEQTETGTFVERVQLHDTVRDRTLTIL